MFSSFTINHFLLTWEVSAITRELTYQEEFLAQPPPSMHTIALSSSGGLRPVLVGILYVYSGVLLVLCSFRCRVLEHSVHFSAPTLLPLNWCPTAIRLHAKCHVMGTGAVDNGKHVCYIFPSGAANIVSVKMHL